MTICTEKCQELYNTIFSRGVIFAIFMRILILARNFSPAKIISVRKFRRNFLPRIFPPRENKILNARRLLTEISVFGRQIGLLLYFGNFRFRLLMISFLPWHDGMHLFYGRLHWDMLLVYEIIGTGSPVCESNGKCLSPGNQYFTGQ